MLINNLSNDVTNRILQYYTLENPRDVLIIRLVSKVWNNTLNKSIFWQHLIFPHTLPHYKYTVQEPELNDSIFGQLIPFFFPDRTLEELEFIEGRVIDTFSDDTTELACILQEKHLLISNAKRLNESQTLDAHGESVIGARFLSNGKLVSWSDDGVLRLSDPNDFADLLILEGHTQKIRGVSNEKEGKLLSWGVEGEIIVWDLNDPENFITLEVPRAEACTTGATFLKTGEILSWGYIFRLWNVENGTHIDLPNLRGIMNAYELENGDLLTHSMGNIVSLWRRDQDVLTPEQLGICYGVFPLSNHRIATWKMGSTFTITDINKESQPITCQSENLKFITKLQLTSQNELMTIGDNKTIELWDLDDFSQCKTLECQTAGYITNVKILNSGNILITYQNGTRLLI